MPDLTSPSDGRSPLYYERALAWYGWKPSGVSLCPHSVAGKTTCPTRWGYGYCSCLATAERAGRPGGFNMDHATMWLDPERPPQERIVLTFEPYEAQDINGLRAWVRPLGVHVNELPRSMWWPGVTRLYAISHPGVANRFVEQRTG